MLPVLQSGAVKVTGMRFNSETARTRVVIELDAAARYQANYTSEHGISICLLETGLGTIRKTVNVDDEMVKSIALKEVIGDIVNVNISLKSGASFGVFPLESPDRIVIDIAQGAIAGGVQPPVILASDSVIENEAAETPERLPHDAVAETVDSKFIFPPLFANHTLFQLCFDAFLLIALIIMGFKLWRVARVSRKNFNTLKKGHNFADMISRVQQGVEKEQQRVASAKPSVLDKVQKRKKEKEQAVQPMTLPKQYEKVRKLAQLGMDRMTISQQSNIPIGEVNLILDLSKARSQAKSN